MKAKMRPVAAEISTRPLRVALRLWDLSEWCRQVVRGVQRFVHDRPNWRLYVDSGPPGHSRVLRGDLEWDGVITAVLREEKAWLKLMRRKQTQLVAISAVVPPSLRAMPAVRIDDIKVADAIGRHFAAGGFRKVAYVGNAFTGLENHRAQGVAAYANANGFPFEAYMQKSTGDMHMPTLTRWIRKVPKPVGVATWNMEVARNVADACQRAGIAVPAEVAIVAWDDDIMLAETLEPTISAVVLPAERLGFESARQLDRLLNGHAAPSGPVMVEPSGVLHVRQSSDVASLVDRDVHSAVQHIREKAAGPLKVEQLCKLLGVSRRKLEQDFRRVTGNSLHEAIVRIRLERAKQLLLETDWSADKIADRSGLGTLRTMDRVFLKYDRCTPSRYRARKVTDAPDKRL